MSFEERERFARELEEGGGDAFDRALDRFRRAFAEANGHAHSGKDEDAIWSSLDFSAARLLAVGALTGGLHADSDDFRNRHEEESA